MAWNRIVEGTFSSIVVWVAVSLASAGTGCNQRQIDESETGCVPGRVQTCECVGGGRGTRRCEPNGTFGACECGDDQDGGPADDAHVSGVDADPPPDTRAGTADGFADSLDSGSGSEVDGGDTGPPPSRTVELPLEVIGPDGYTKQMTVEVTEPSEVTEIWLKAYSIGYPYFENYDVDKASVRINDGEWVDITNDVAECQFPESKLECVSGPYATIRFSIPIETFGASALEAGENTLIFRFNYAFPEDSPDDFGDKSTGYRILGVEFRDTAGNDHIDDTAFVWDDPSEWTAPESFGDAESIAEGEELWNKRNALIGSWQGDPITASCADCHASNGRDLKYFAFSNWSIIARSEFHGLSQKQGKKIAAFIRSIELEDPDDGHTYEAPGRPWHPPYQPGPTRVPSRAEDAPRTEGTRITEMPSNGSQYAAAGAGVEWALDRDREMLPYVYPDGPSSHDFEIDQTRDGLHVPVPLQFPDWNEWLPTHHPIDIYGKQDLKDFEGRFGNFWEIIVPAADKEGKTSLEDFRECAHKKGPDDNECVGKLGSAARKISMEIDNFEGDRSDIIEPGYENTTNQHETGFKHTQVEKWGLVRVWQTLETYDAGDEMANAEFRRGPNDNVDRYQWPGTTFPFDLAPHVSGTYAGPKKQPFDLVLDNVWYEMAVRINSGRGHKLGNRPVDWQYQHGHLFGMGKHLGLGQPLRRVFSQMKVLEVCESFKGYDDSTPRAWSINRRICGAFLGETYGLFRQLDTYQEGLHRKTFEILFEEQVEAMMYRHSPDLGDNVDKNWKRIEDSRRGWEPADAHTIDTDPGDLNASFWFAHGGDPTHFYHILALGNDLGVEPTLLDRAADWLDAMTPSDKWNRFKCQSQSDAGELGC